MGNGLKVFLWVIGILVVLIGLLIGAGVYVGFQAKGAIEEADVFARSATKLECLDELARLSSTCSGSGACVVSHTLFGLRCLRVAKGPTEEICLYDNPPREQAQLYCSAHVQNDHCDEIVRETISAFCIDPDAEAILPFGDRAR